MTVFLAGNNISFRPLELDDLDLFHAWFADREVVRYSMGMWQFPWSRGQTLGWLERTMQDKETLSLGVVENENQHLIGYAGITSISRINRSGEYYILIGEKNRWGKGYGTEVTQRIVHYGFASLNLHRTMLTVSSLNIGGIKAYTRAGFQQEGILRQACYRDGEYHDKIVMSILRPEWESLYPIT